jgi:hypothetical protein
MGALLEQIDELLDAPAPDGASAATATRRIERTLTEGYAHALALEAERMRLHRRLGEAASNVQDAGSDGVDEISTLAKRLAEADAELGRLRERLQALRSRAQDLRLLPRRDGHR